MLERMIITKTNIPATVALNITVEILAVAGLLYAFAARMINFAHPLPLWTDETFTGAIAGQKKWHDFITLARVSTLKWCF